MYSFARSTRGAGARVYERSFHNQRVVLRGEARASASSQHVHPRGFGCGTHPVDFEEPFLYALDE
jgi:hypothetical protein